MLFRSHRVAINLIGCHQPVELILAKADVRIRKQTHANSVREQGSILPLFSSFSTYFEFFFISSLSLLFFLLLFCSSPACLQFFFIPFCHPILFLYFPVSFLTCLYSFPLHPLYFAAFHSLSSSSLSVCLSFFQFLSFALSSYSLIFPLTLLSSVFLVSVRISLFLLSCPRSPSPFLFF